MSEAPSGTVTLVFSDIEGSTRLLRRLGDGYAEQLAQHRALLRRAFESNGGYVVEGEGDAFFVAFRSAADAVAGAAEAQRALAGHEWPEGNEIRVRIGLHTGEPRLIDGRYVGLDVHQAARVTAAAHGGQVLLTEASRALLGEDVELRDLGEHVLKDLSGPHRLYQLEIEGLPGDFPPLNTEAGRTTNLPVPPNVFIGRKRELAEAGELLARADVRLLTLMGPGGTGKTRLALKLAGEVGDRFPGGVFFVPLAPLRDWRDAVPTIARTLGLHEQSGETALETVIEGLRGRELLLVLDNFEHVVGAAPALSEFLAGSTGLKLLVTSRRPLSLRGEWSYLVSQLELPALAATAEEAAAADSVKLFVERAQSAAEGFELDDENATAVAEICVRLDGLPLAIELAAAWMRTLTPVALLRRLDQRLPLLTGGSRDVDERQRTLRNAIDWSYGLLSEQEQRLFRRLAVFVGGCRPEAAEGVGGHDVPAGAVLEDLSSLLEKSLLVRRTDSDGESRFRMLETIREYASVQLEAAGEPDELRRLHARWFTELAESLDAEFRTGDQPWAVARFGEDYANFRAAIRWAREQRDGELLLRIATALSPFWSTRGYVAEGRKALEDALELAGRRPARALLGLSSLRLFSGNSDGLLDEVHDALSAAEELGDPRLLAQGWNLLGRVEGTMIGAMARAEQAWRKALEHAERGNLRAERAESIGWLMMCANFGPLPVEDGITLCRHFHDEAVDDPFIQGNADVERAALEAMRGDFDLARTLIAQGRQTIVDLGLSLIAATTAQEAFYIEILAGDTGEALRIMHESYAELEPMGERSYLSTAAALLAHALCARGELVEAERFSRRSEETSARDDAFSQVLWRSARAKIHAHGGDLTGAEELGRHAVALAEETDLLNIRGDTLADYAEVLALDGRYIEAAAAFERAADLFERKGNSTSLQLVRRSARDLSLFPG
jgi:predicted ATPase/class 3 adenylate cyclase